MAHKIVYRPEAHADLDGLLTRISEAAGWPVANAYVGGIIDLIEGLRTFPKRGTERSEILPGLASSDISAAPSSLPMPK